MKTDRELLELAAKAAGMVGWWIDYDQKKWINPSGFYLVPHVLWSPLTDNGEALFLAVKLGITITPGEVMCAASAPGAETHQAELVDGDIYAATRRAIVRAAAAIGEQIK